MEKENTEFCGFDTGEDWLVDIAVENYRLKRGNDETETKNIQPNNS